MKRRRQFLKTVAGWMAAVWFLENPVVSAVRSAFAATRKSILPKDIEREDLIFSNPADLDTRNIEITPLQDFETGGLSNYQTDLKKWSLTVAGDVRTSVELSYDQILKLPSIEKEVLLICPDIFANHGRWKGISVKELTQLADANRKVQYVTFSGPAGPYQKEKRYPMADILSDRVFLAYGVNGEILPVKHGFPLRVVAEGYFGHKWLKYVDSVNVE